MDFKFKEVLEESIIYFYDHVLSSNEHTEDVFKELDHLYSQSPKADEYEAKNKELLEELKYLKKVNHDLTWQRDTDEEHEAKAKAFDETIEILKELRDFSKQTEPHSQRMKVKRRNYVQFCDEVLREIKLSYKEIIDEYESGELE